MSGDLSPSPTVEAGQRRLRQRVRVCIEAYNRGRSVLVDVELVDVQRVDRDDVVVRLARRRAGAAIARGAVVVPSLHRAGRHSGPASRAFWQGGGVGGKID